jgi:thiamine biosynthesis lipoprotein
MGDIIASDIYEEAKRLEAKYSFFLHDSVIGKINNRTTSVVEIDSETVDIFEQIQELSSTTNLAFDITKAGTLKSGTSPYLLDYATSEHIFVEKKEVWFSNPYTKVDFGGVIKEYALDAATKILKLNAIDNALIDFGGDISILGSKHDKPWLVGIKNPKEPRKDLFVLELTDISIATSGLYERGSHIVSQNSSRYIQASCIGKSAMHAGVFSTALLADDCVEPNAGYAAILVNESLCVDLRGNVA